MVFEGIVLLTAYFEFVNRCLLRSPIQKSSLESLAHPIMITRTMRSKFQLHQADLLVEHLTYNFPRFITHAVVRARCQDTISNG